MTSVRVKGNSRSAYNLKIKKKKEEKDAIKHGTRKVTNTSRTGKKEYKYWDSNKRKWVKKENFTKEDKSFKKTNPNQTLSNEEIKKLQDKADEDRTFGKLSSRTDKGYQKPDTPPELKDTTTESSNEVTQKQLDAKIKERKLRKKYGEVTQEQLDKKIANPDAKVKGKDKEQLKVKPKKMHRIEKENRKRFGDAHVDKLKAQYAKFKADRKKKKKK
tara:strand:+ start:99 stop:746 length:648 start_codon:yes stop_codon:yes gene_type:complete